LASTGLSQSRLTLEITESAFLSDDRGTVAALNDLRGLGVRISLDDFGTGYSSLSYVQKFPFDVIKIDRTFTSHIDRDKINAAAVRAIIALARDLGISVVAEGVETPEERDALVALGCDKAQGYLFGRPQAPSQLFPGIDAAIPQRLPAGLAN
jgi:EAL domain-containing protein (putative c-di-GMP-specific phosphodiesterase class I)